MGLSHSPRMITDGLIAYWDAANPKSYTGDSSIWYDLSGNGHHAYGDPGAEGAGYDDGNFPSWEPNNGGRFSFDLTQGLTVLTDMGARSVLTVDMWIYKTGTGLGYLFDARNNGGSYWIANYSTGNFNMNTSLKANDPSLYQTNSNWWDRWINVVITSNSGGSALWINGEAITDDRLIASNSVPETLGQYFRIGARYTSTGRWNGYWSNLRFYNRVLSDIEIQNNFNSLRGRFGI